MACKQTPNEKYAGGFPPGIDPFENVTDPRNGKAKRHYFGEILFTAQAAMICGMEGFYDFERFAKLKEVWLRRVFINSPTAGPATAPFGASSPLISAPSAPV